MAVAAVSSQETLKPHLDIRGEHKLDGVLTVSGAKNSALVLMTASLLTEETVELVNVPDLTDISGMGKILESLGVHVEHAGDRIALTASNLSRHNRPTSLSTASRASFFSIGSLLGRLGHARSLCPVDAALELDRLWNTSVVSNPSGPL